MREMFSAYYPLSEEQFKALWNEASIILDTNVLFGLYRYSQETSNELLGLFCLGSA